VRELGEVRHQPDGPARYVQFDHEPLDAALELADVDHAREHVAGIGLEHRPALRGEP
jgi:hypothetical protein